MRTLFSIDLKLFQFSFMVPTKRDMRFWWQRRTRGWSDDDTFSLDHTCAKLILPRLKRFKELSVGDSFDGTTEEEWGEIVDKMIVGIELHAKGNWDCNAEEREQAKEGLRLFGEYYSHLWW